MLAGRQRRTSFHKALASILAVSLVLPLFPVSVRASAHDCAGMPGTTAAAVITATGNSGACADAVRCGPTLCCTGPTPVLIQSAVLQPVSVGVISISLASGTQVPRLFLGGPPTPPPNS